MPNIFQSNTCNVCLEQYNDTFDKYPVSLRCGHVMCKPCSRRVKGVCPVDRRPFKEANIQRLFNDGEEESPEEKLHSAIDSFARLTQKNTDLEAQNRQMSKQQRENDEKMTQLEVENRQLRAELDSIKIKPTLYQHDEVETTAADNKPKLDQKETSCVYCVYTPNHLASAKLIALKVLTPYFTAGRFKEKPLLKEMAKLLTKCLCEVDSAKHENTRIRAKMATKRIVKNFFFRVDMVTASADLKKLCLADLAELKQPSAKENDQRKTG